MALAMLATAAMAAPAAPQAVHGVTITYPTTASPAYVNPDVACVTATETQGDSCFKAKFTVSPVGVQDEGIRVKYVVIDSNGVDPLETEDEFDQPFTLNATGGIDLVSIDPLIPADETGWYKFQVCVQDENTADPDTWFCTTQDNAVFIDNEKPGVELMKPADMSVVTGKEYPLIGSAWDPAEAEDSAGLIERYGKIVETWFDWCSNAEVEAGECPEDAKPGPDSGWIKICSGVPNGVGDTYQCTWDTSQIIPDKHGAVRFCAKDLVGLVECEKANVVVENRWSIELEAGWNLISTPVMLYDADVDAVLLHLIASGKVADVYAMANNNTSPNTYTWQKWVPGDAMKINHGAGYWINMLADGDLTFVGAYMGIGPETPPEYPVYEGWNLIGYTHWGQPSAEHFFTDKLVGDYLGIDIDPKLEAMWRFDAASYVYVPMSWFDFMMKGAGYWLALSDGSSINP